MKKAIIKMLSILCVGLMIVSSAGESIYAASYSNPKQQVSVQAKSSKKVTTKKATNKKSSTKKTTVKKQTKKHNKNHKKTNKSNKVFKGTLPIKNTIINIPSDKTIELTNTQIKLPINLAPTNFSVLTGNVKVK